ncbi:MAG: hypothetical protein J6O60_01670 [Lachnospiraceae bacterium]|nr:hypothetical protein [Lachnospiraceae bacterium]
MKTAIIDSGIDLKYIEFNDKNIEISDADYRDENGHGTACVSEFFLVNPKGFVTVYKIYDDNNKCSLFSMVNVLERIADRDDISIISISGAFDTDDDEIIEYTQEIINKLYKKNILVIASEMNGKQKKGYPACLKHVLAVKKIKFPIRLMVHYKERAIFFGKDNWVPKTNGEYIRFDGNSSAAPRVSAYYSKCVGMCCVEKIFDSFEVIFRGI